MRLPLRADILAQTGTGPQSRGSAESDAFMRYRTRSIAWEGQHFQFQRLRPKDSLVEQAAQWAVSRRGEFIGTMPCPEQVTTSEFELRCFRWLADLLPKTQRPAARPQ